MVRCHNCGAEQKPGQQFCSSCGAGLEMAAAARSSSTACPVCGAAQAVWYQFCDSCGTPARPAAASEGPYAGLADGPTGGPRFGPGGPAGVLGAVDRSWSARWERGLRLTRLSVELIRQQPGLLWVPVAAAAAIAIAYLLAYMFSQVLPTGVAVVFWLAAAVFMASVSAVSQAVILHRVSVAAAGSSESNSQALAAVTPKVWTLASWGTLSLAVGTLIRGLERGQGWGGFLLRLLAATLQVAWSALTFFVVPVIVFEDLGVRDAIRRSRELLRVSWGEGVIGVTILSLVYTLIILAAFVLAIVFASAHLLALAVLVVLVAVLGVTLLSCVASPVFTFVLYRFATTGETAFGLTVEDLAAAFRPRRRIGFAGGFR